MKKLKKKALALGKGAIGLGIGSQMLGTMNGGVIAAKGQAGMGAMAGAFKPVGTIIGTGLTLGALDTLRKSVPKRKRKRRK